MQDPAFKRLFSHPAAIESVVRRYAFEYAEEIDFSTLKELNPELVGEALVRRYPDMLWAAHTRDGSSRVLILLEFQGAHDPLMPLRIAIYQLLSVQALLRRTRLATPRSVEVLSFVIYHGEGRWRTAARLQNLFPRWVPGDYWVIAREQDEGTARASGRDLARTVLDLEKDWSVASTVATLRELTQIADETGSRYDSLMAECVLEMLVSSGRITTNQVREVTTMAQVMTEYERSLEEYGKTWFRQGRDEGRAEILCQQVDMLCLQAGMKFGPEVAEELRTILGELWEADRIPEAASAVIDCATAEEFLARVRRTRPA